MIFRKRRDNPKIGKQEYESCISWTTLLQDIVRDTRRDIESSSIELKISHQLLSFNLLVRQKTSPILSLCTQLAPTRVKLRRNRFGFFFTNPQPQQRQLLRMPCLHLGSLPDHISLGLPDIDSNSFSLFCPYPLRPFLGSS